MRYKCVWGREPLVRTDLYAEAAASGGTTQIILSLLASTGEPTAGSLPATGRQASRRISPLQSVDGTTVCSRLRCHVDLKSRLQSHFSFRWFLIVTWSHWASVIFTLSLHSLSWLHTNRPTCYSMFSGSVLSSSSRRFKQPIWSQLGGGTSCPTQSCHLLISQTKKILSAHNPKCPEINLKRQCVSLMRRPCNNVIKRRHCSKTNKIKNSHQVQ